MQAQRLSRSMVDRAFGGVCGGLGRYLGINGWWVRAAFMVFTVFTPWVSIVLYMILWMIMPQQSIDELPPGDPIRRETVSAETLVLLGSGVVFMGIAVLAVNLGVLQGSGGDILLPFVVIGLGIVLLAQQLRR